MPKVSTTPKNLKPYQFHGVSLDYEDGADQAYAACPFCDREKKFSVNISTGVWRCFVCNEGTDKGQGIAGGNSFTFLRRLYDLSKPDEGTIRALAEDRRLLSWESLKAWGVRVSLTTRDIIVPGYGADGKLNQLYRYLRDFSTKKMRLLPTPEIGHQIFGMSVFDPKKHLLYVCEGPWDGIALWETLQMARYEGDTLVVTASESSSLYSHSNILAVPGCNSPLKPLADVVGNRGVSLLFDNDHPRGPNKARAGYDGAKRLAEGLAKIEEAPAELHHLNWGKDGYDPDRKDGYDVRDWLTAGEAPDDPASRVSQLQELLGNVTPIPDDWVAGRSKGKAAKGELDLELVACTTWKTLQNACFRAMKWTDGLDCAFSVMLASITSTKALGDQLWVKIIGPASCGKSTLCEAVSANKRHVLAKSTITGFHSGFKTDGGETDNSLLAVVQNKTLVTKDGDTLLKKPNVAQILSEARDVYDRVSRTHYRHGLAKDYEGLNMTWILCGTSSLRALDSSELGERFLDCVIMEGIDVAMEDDVLWRVVNNAERSLNFEADGSAESQNDPDRLMMMQLTGGYIDYLRANARELLSSVDSPQSALRHIIHLGTFVAYMRARPSKEQDETAEREFAARLVSQLMRLAKCLAVVLNKPTLDAEVMRRVTKVALDTSRGITFDIAKHLFAAGTKGMETKTLSMYLGQTEEKTRGVYLKFLRLIGAAEFFTPVENAIKGRPRWRLTERVYHLYSEVVGHE